MRRTKPVISKHVNDLFYGDNLDIMKKHIKDESVDLIYLDPPFNSNVNYNAIFKNGSREVESQIQAFNDTWKWGNESSKAFDEVMNIGGQVASILEAFRIALGENDMIAYLTMMAPRLIEMRRVLKPTGSIYLHCDPTASHYLKILMDSIFGVKNFRNELIWCYKKWSNAAAYFQKNHDDILFYTKSNNYIFNKIYEEKGEKDRNKWIEKGYYTTKMGDKKRLIVLDKNKSKKVIEEKNYDEIAYSKSSGILWYDWFEIPRINPMAKERIGYPTQKPLSLMERIIRASSNRGDVILDPFCGGGTTLHAAQKIGRKWIGIDITHVAVGIVETRLKDNFKDAKYRVYGDPKSLSDARKLCDDDKFQFEAWAVTRIKNMVPNQKQRGDKGIDGTARIRVSEKKYIKVIAQVKGGKTVNPSDIRDFRGTIERDKVDIGIFICLDHRKISNGIKKEAAAAGRFKFEEGFINFECPKIQIFSIRDYFKGRKPELP